jgi:hypothetical protein
MILETLRTAPDFAVINQETKSVKLIEVKYMHLIKSEYVLKYAKRMSKSWNPSFLFITLGRKPQFFKAGDECLPGA